MDLENPNLIQTVPLMTVADYNARITALQQQLNVAHNSFTEQQQVISRLVQQVDQLTLNSIDPPVRPVHAHHNPDLVDSPLPRGYKPPALDAFHGHKGEDLHAWLFQAKEHFSLLDIQSDITKIRLSGLALKDHARTWYVSVGGTAQFHTWEDFATALKTHFSPVDPSKSARDEIRHFRQTRDMSVMDYTTRFSQLVNLIPKMADDEKLDKYVHGLKSHLRTQTFLRNPKTYLQATAIAHDLDLTYDRAYHTPEDRSRPVDRSTPMDLDITYFHRSSRDERSPSRSPSRHDRDYSSSPRYDRERFPPSRTGRDNTSQHNRGQRRVSFARPPLTASELQGRKDRNECVYCGSAEHLRVNCPLQKQGKGLRRFPQGNA